MPDLSTLDTAILDDDGYPSDEAAALITTWTGTPRALVHDLINPVFNAYGSVSNEFVLNDLGRSVVKVRLVTGGWSGCEEAISALDMGMFSFAWWRSSERGGASTYEVPLDQWETPMYPWPLLPTAYARGWGRASEVTLAELDQIRAVEGLPAAALATIDRLDAFLQEGPGE